MSLWPLCRVWNIIVLLCAFHQDMESGQEEEEEEGVYVSADKSVAPPLLIISGKRLNRDVIEGCDIQGANITTAPKGFVNSTLFLNCLEFFAESVPGSVVRPIVLVYDRCCSL